MDFHIIIPARYHSSRLPGKMLMDIKGKTLIARVYEQALKCQASSVTIATDDEKIEKEAIKIGANYCRTNSAHPNGTDRIIEAAQILKLKDDDIVINLQGDEPLVPTSIPAQLAKELNQNREAFMATICVPILNKQQVKNPNVVKVVLDKKGFALYFSRSMIPYIRDDSANHGNRVNRADSDNSTNRDDSANRDNTPNNDIYDLQNIVYHKHVGVYAYRVNALKRYATFPSSPLEEAEKLEQLRVLWQGEKIFVSIFSQDIPKGVDTIEDLENIRLLVK